MQETLQLGLLMTFQLLTTAIFIFFFSFLQTVISFELACPITRGTLVCWDILRPGEPQLSPGTAGGVTSLQEGTGRAVSLLLQVQTNAAGFSLG